jgi:hypothetical protein
MAITERQFWDLAQAAQIKAAETWGLEPGTAARYGVIDAIFRAYTGRGAPPIISGYRSPGKTRDLLRRWEAGDPSVRFKPASRSWHMAGRAFDVHSDDRLPTMQRLWELLGGRSGVTFGDNNHFDLPGPERPQPAF